MYLLRKKIFSEPLMYLKGVGEYRAEVLKNERGFSTYRDLLLDFPRDYVDKSILSTIAEAVNTHAAGKTMQFKGRFRDFSMHKLKGRQKRLQATFYDGSGELRVNWFRKATYIREMLDPKKEYVSYGKLSSYKGSLSFNHPELTEAEKFQKSRGLQPVYSSSEILNKSGLDSKRRAALMRQIFSRFKERDVPETLPGWLLDKFKLVSAYRAIRQIHFPENKKQLREARRRLKFEETFFDQLTLISKKHKSRLTSRGFVFDTVGKQFNRFYENHLPFELTGAQKRVMKEIRRDLGSGHHMNRLVQGDVGSGKTIVALLSTLIAIDNGYQTCIMAPTEVLARQHYSGVSDYLSEMDLRVGFLSGNVLGEERASLLEEVRTGACDILIGTHAVIQEPVKFKDLGLAIIDEQHRFGVAQRAALWKKNSPINPHILVMTATPIPRTLALTLYGNLETSLIDEMPPGRKDVKTFHVSDANRIQVYDFIKQQIAKGQQVYVVYPLIEESMKLDLVDIENGYRKMRNYFPAEKYHLSIVHGQMKQDVKEYEMAQFVNGNTQIMLATTVIEVGVNVPNASIMLIENVERFGLSQLHQLRGRVGRGAEQSFCFLMTGDKVSREARKRIEIMVASNDGFVIAKKDLEMRGPGQVAGTRQSGEIEFRILDLSRDDKIIYAAQEVCEEVLSADPHLQEEKHALLREYMQTEGARKKHWSDIS